ncbi:MAG: translation initiation factor IF-2 [Candidatus Marinimicrobia bacterium]|nr:translation initiation factor IF-2 [Candidatus Neomarinimicrobiota bacterium]
MPSDTKTKKPLSLGRGKLELKKTVETGQVRQSFSHGRSKVVQVERKRKRQFEMSADGTVQEVKAPTLALKAKAEEALAKSDSQLQGTLTEGEKAHRLKALQDSIKAGEEAKRQSLEEEAPSEPEGATVNEAESDSALKVEETESPAEETATTKPAPQPQEAAIEPVITPLPRADAQPDSHRSRRNESAAEEEDTKPRKSKTGHKAPTTKRDGPRRRAGKLTISAALEGDDAVERSRSIASMRRAVEKERRKAQKKQPMNTEKVVREVVLPETITVQELSNRVAERSGTVIKALMKLGVMATINEVIDADTAELVAQEFGHRVKRITEASVEDSLQIDQDDEKTLKPRPPVVTVMGHVDHGKTSLLDALRSSSVVSGEAGGITQHIGAYQVRTPKNQKITFIDTPGHEAFTAMRARGAKATDIVVLVVAADDSIMPQTVEAIKHAKAGDVPMVVAINKMDKEGADPSRVKTDLLSHEVVVEDMGGDTLCIEVSATQKKNLDKLEEAILLQAELLDLKANPKRHAEGTIIEAKMEKGVGPVGTVLVRRGTLHVGDIFVAGAEWGRVRALVNDRNKQVKSAMPSAPVEVVGFGGIPEAGDDFIVTADEVKAREVSEYRKRKIREKEHVSSVSTSTMEQMFAQIKAGEVKELGIVVKADVQGSVEALSGTLQKLGTDEIKVNVIHGAVGPVNESDVTLARASGAVIIGFNVRANTQARELSKRDAVDIRYYSIIYDVADDLRALLTGMLAPQYKESFIGYAEVREVFTVSKVGKVAGCMVTQGLIKRGCKVRLLRDDVVIHEGDLSQLKRFKDDAKEVREGYECGMALVNYQDIQPKDVIECFELEQIAASL